MSCVLCDRDPEVGEAVFENGSVRVLLHSDSAVRGHALVVSTRHVENVADLTDEEAWELTRIERAAERALLDATGTDRAILLKLGIQTPHLHLHIFPVSASLDRTAVMRIIDGSASEARDESFASDVRERLQRLTSRDE